MGNLVEVQVPDIGDYQGVPVIELLVKDGDTVEKDQSLIVLESDKATMEVPSPGAGIVRGLKVKVGDKLSKGDRICRLESEAGSAAAPEKPATAKAEPEKPPPAKAAVESPAKKEKAAAPDLFTSAQAEPAEDSPPPQEDKKVVPAEPAATTGRSTTLAVTVPDIGDFKDVPVIELLVKDGELVAKDQALMVLESEKSTMEVPSPGAGTVRGLKVKVGDKVSKGDALLELETAGETKETNALPAKAKDPEVREKLPEAAAVPPLPRGEAAALAAGEGESAAPPEKLSLSPAPDLAKQGMTLSHSLPAKSPGGEGRPATPMSPSPDATAHAGPATRKFARELGVDLSKVHGSGPKDRVVIDDVQKFVKQQMTAAPETKAPSGAATAAGSGIPPIPPQDFSLYGEIESKPLSRIRKLSAAYLHRSWLNVPRVTQTDEADITELEAFRKSAGIDTGVKLTLLPFIMKAVGVAIRQYPEFGSSLSPDGGSLILKKYCHLGFAADTPNGLLVPVVRDVWNKSLTQLAQETGELAKKARDGKLKADEMKGGCFSISSLGGIGGSHFTPIINAPEVGILGVSRALMKPVWDGKAFQPRLMVPLSLAYDHRVIDGAYAARFIVALVKLLADIRRLSL